MQSIFDIDPTFRIEETTQAQIRRHPALIEFIKTHCHIRAYSFQVCINNILIINSLIFLFINDYFKIKKCNNAACLYCKPIRLPLSEFNNLNFLPDPIPSQGNQL